MNTDFDAVVSFETGNDEDGYRDITIEIGLHCTVGSFGGFFNPITGNGEPPSGPEFEPTYIRYIDGDDKSLDLSWKEFEEKVGAERADQLFEDAYMQAADSGEF